MYGFEVDGKRSVGYRAFFERYLLHSQRQTVKTTALLASGALKGWHCSYARGKGGERENANFDMVAALVRDGLPSKNRGEMWLQLTGVAGKLKLYGGVFESLLEPYEQADAYGISSSPSTIQIEKDVPRTFPGYIWTPKGKQFQPSLRRLLRAYAMRNPKLGYCQSMNFIAGGLLLFLEETEAFWLLCFVVEELLPDYFVKNIIGPQVDAEVLAELMAEQLPQLRDHFDAIGLNIALVCTQWFMCLFMRTLPFECAFRIWDSLFLYGPKVLFEVGLSILKIYQKDLLLFTDTIDVVTHLGASLTDIFDCSVIWDTPISPLDHKRIAASREIQKEKVLRDMRMKADVLDLMDIFPSSKFSRETLEQLCSQYTNLGVHINLDIVEKGLPKAIFYKVIMRIFPAWRFEEYFFARLFKMFDVNHNHNVDFKELISGLSVLCKGSNEEKLTMFFNMFDRNCDGLLDRDDLNRMLTSVYAVYQEPPKIKEEPLTIDTPKEETKDPEPPSPTPFIFRSISSRALGVLTRSASSRSLQTSSPLISSSSSSSLSLSANIPKSSAPSPILLSRSTPPEVFQQLSVETPQPAMEKEQAIQIDKKPSPTSPRKERPSSPPPILLPSSPTQLRRPSSPPSSWRPSSPSSFRKLSLKENTKKHLEIIIPNTEATTMEKQAATTEKQTVTENDYTKEKRTNGKRDSPTKEIQDPVSKERHSPQTEKRDSPTKEQQAIPPASPTNRKNSSPEQNRVDPDYASEMACYLDMFYKLDANKDGLLSLEEFREAALLHPYILKIFNLDGHPEHNHYDLRIAIE